MFRYRLRSLLIVLALGPSVLAGAWRCYWAVEEACEIAALHAAVEKYKLGRGDYPSIRYTDHDGLWIEGVQVEPPHGP